MFYKRPLSQTSCKQATRVLLGLSQKPGANKPQGSLQNHNPYGRPTLGQHTQQFQFSQMEKVLSDMETCLTNVESSLLPTLNNCDIPKLVSSITPLENARLHAELATATAVLLTSYLRLSGVDTSHHEIAQEFQSIHKLNSRIKQVGEEEGKSKSGVGESKVMECATEPPVRMGTSGNGGVGAPRGGGILNVPASRRFIAAGLGSGR